MYIYILYLITAVFLLSAAYKANYHRAEWIVLLLIMSFVKTCIMYLFEATTVFTVFTIGGTQVHLDDIILIWLLLYCIIYMIRNGIVATSYFGCQMLIFVPLLISLLRGFINGTIGSAQFLSDTRKFILFVVVLMAVYFIFGQWNTYERKDKIIYYIDNLMNVVIAYVLVVWALDVAFGVNSLPGQINGTLSDGGSTLRIINPPQVLMIAFYTLWNLYRNLNEDGSIKIRTFLLVFITILMQWRTVVAAFIVGLILVLIGYYVSNRGASARPVFQIGGVGVLGLILSAVSGGGIIFSSLENLFSSYANMSSGSGTFATRTDVWSMLITSLNGINRWIGQPFGSARSSSVDWTASAHSGYVDYIMIAGYIGCACLIAFMIFLLVKAVQKRNVLIFALVASLLVYWYGYGFSLEQGAVLGVILAVLENYEMWTGVNDEAEAVITSEGVRLG